MANFSVLYDGKNSAVRLPDLDKTEKALSRSADLQIRGEEMKLDKSLKDKERLLDTMKTVPLSFHNEMLMTRQAAELEKYNNLGAFLYAKYGTDLPITKQIELGNAKSALEQKQKTWQAQSEIAQGLQSVISRDVRGYYDHDEFNNRYKAWLKNPDQNPLDDTALSVAPQDIAVGLSSSKMTGTPDVYTDIKVVKDPTGKETRWATDYASVMTRDEAKRAIPQFAMNNEAYLKDIINRFDKADPSEQIKYLSQYDTNKNGVLDPQEKQYAYENAEGNNAILKWASENEDLIKSAMRLTPKGSATEVKERTSTGSGSNDSSWASLKIGNGKAIAYQPSDRMSVTLGSSDYSTYHVIPEWPTMTIPTTNVEIQTPQGNKEKTTVRSIAVQPTGYDEDKDEFTFIAKSNYKGGGTMGTGDQIAIKRQYVPREFDNFEILVNGQRIKIKDLKREQPQNKVGALDNL